MKTKEEIREMLTAQRDAIVPTDPPNDDLQGWFAQGLRKGFDVALTELEASDNLDEWYEAVKGAEASVPEVDEQPNDSEGMYVQGIKMAHQATLLWVHEGEV